MCLPVSLSTFTLGGLLMRWCDSQGPPNLLRGATRLFLREDFMSNIEKSCIWLFVFIVSSIGFTKSAYSLEPIIEHSIVYQKNTTLQGNLNDLFDELGINFIGNDRLNPCHEIEELTRKYCTPNSLRVLLDEDAFVPSEEKLLRKFLSGNRACDDTAEHIGRVCYLENFKKIFKHYSLKN